MKRRDPLKEWAHGDKQPPGVRARPGDPDYDAEDLPHWWQRWLSEGAGVIALVAVLIAAVIVAAVLAPLFR